jgi:putative glutamine amidotransferase
VSLPSRLKIGISACFFHPDAQRPIFTGKTLQYVEESIAHWVMSTGSLAVMIPSPAGRHRRGDVTVADYAEWLDGLVLRAAPMCGRAATARRRCSPEWTGDRVRDEYEMALVHAFAGRASRCSACAAACS